MPPEFNGLSADTPTDIRIPWRAYPLLADSPELTYLELAGRLRPGVTTSRASAECLAIWTSAMKDYYANVAKGSPADTAAYIKRGMNLESLSRGASAVRERMGNALKLLMAVVTVLVLIIGLNVAGLLLPRAITRHQEMVIRLAVGATRWRLARQMAAESFLLSAFGAAAALLSTFILTPVALRMLPPVRDLYGSIVPVSINAGVNAQVLIFLMAITALTMLIITVGPTLAMLRSNIDSVLRSVRSSGNLRGRQFSVALQIALCTVLLTFAGELTRSFQKLANTDTGFASDRIATFTCDLEGYKRVPSFLQTLLNRVRQVPGVISLATSSNGVMREHGMSANIALAGQRVRRAEIMGVNANRVSSEYFDTMGIKILSGRNFLASDTPKPSSLLPRRPLSIRPLHIGSLEVATRWVSGLGALLKGL